MEKRILGKGLAALIASTMPEESEAQVREVPLEQVAPNPYQPRTLFDPLKMEDLVASIRAHGILQPILIRRVGHEKYQIVAGERRFRAAQAAGLVVIPALVKNCTEQELLEMAVVENLQREDIGVMETARAYRRMIDEFTMTQDTIAQRVGKSRSSIANTVRLLNLPELVQESLERGDISEGHGRALLAGEDSMVILHAWERVIQKRLNVRETERLITELREKAGGNLRGGSSATATGGQSRESANNLQRSSASDPNEEAMVDQLIQALGTKVALKRSAGGSGKIEIDFHSGEELERLIELLIHGRY